MLYPTLFLVTLALCGADVSHLEHEPSTEPPPRPYAFAYTAGRYPGHTDRHHAEVSDGSSVVRGTGRKKRTFSYVDPRSKAREVDYVAYMEGFHPILSDTPPELPDDSESVAKAKNRQYQFLAEEALVAAAAAANADMPPQFEAVVAAPEMHAGRFQVFDKRRARIEATREAQQRAQEQAQQQAQENAKAQQERKRQEIWYMMI